MSTTVDTGCRHRYSLRNNHRARVFSWVRQCPKALARGLSETTKHKGMVIVPIITQLKWFLLEQSLLEQSLLEQSLLEQSLLRQQPVAKESLATGCLLLSTKTAPTKTAPTKTAKPPQPIGNPLSQVLLF